MASTLKTYVRGGGAAEACFEYEKIENKEIVYCYFERSNKKQRLMYDLAESEIEEPLFWDEFRSVVESPSIAFVCKSLYQRVDIHEDGSCSGCCDAWLSKKLCNVMADDGSEVYNSIWAKIMKLSCLLHTYNFCNWDNCPYLRNHKNIRPIEDAEIDYGAFDCVPSTPERLIFNFDPSCNLRCPSCRSEFRAYRLEELTEKESILKNIQGWVENAKFIQIAGYGDPFFSQLYRKCWGNARFNNDLIMYFTTNGQFFSKELFEKAEERIKRIQLAVSIDAATEETYRKIRPGGSFNKLQDNMVYASSLRIERRLERLEMNFVVQMDNYKEMKDFVKWGLDLGVDLVRFTRIVNWGTFSSDEYNDKSINLLDGKLKDEIVEELRNPIFREKICLFDFWSPNE